MNGQNMSLDGFDSGQCEDFYVGVNMPDGLSHYETNPYYHPEKQGLELLGSVDHGASYEFDIVILVRETASGKLYAGHDAGCSCPTPFEGMTLSEMTEIRSRDELREFIRAYDNANPEGAWSYAFDPKGVQSLLEMV